MKTSLKNVLVFSSLLTLTACGGGGGGSGDNTGTVPTSVNAGSDQTINEEQPLTLTAVGFPDGGQYYWTQTAGPVIEGFPLQTAEAAFTTPTVKSEQTVTLRVEYTASGGQVVSDTVDLQVTPVNKAPVAVAKMALPDANPVAPGLNVILDARDSFDQDGNLTAYQWQQISGSPTVTPMTGSASEEFQFVAPAVTQTSELIFRLTVTDDELATANFDVNVVVDPSVAAVVVDAGIDQVVSEGQTVTVSATGTPGDGNYFWSQQTGEALSEFPASTQSVSFTAPSTKQEREYSFRVEYQAPAGQVGHDNVIVRVTPVNKLPVSVIRITQPDVLPADPSVLVTLDGSGSFDPDSDGEIVSYEWQQLSGPETVTREASSTPSQFIFRTPVRATEDTYVFRQTVTDDEGGTGTFDIEVEVLGTSDLIKANAGPDQAVKEFSTVTLDGRESYSIISDVTCSWTQVSGPALSFVNPNNCVSTFVAPHVDTDTDVILELRATNSQANSATDTMKVTISPLNLGKVHDTGSMRCFDNTGVIDCGDEDFPGQDAEFGRDSVASYLDKVGTGAGGFDYTKLDANGDELPNDSTDYSCVRDNFTGLIWEVKETSAVLPPSTSTRDNKNRYTWFLPDGSTGGNEGILSDPRTTCPSTEDCGLATYVAEVNSSVYCGGANWRVPTTAELQSLLNLEQGSATSVINTDIFNDLPDTSITGNLYYWTSETSADGGGTENTWVVNFINGNDNALRKSEATYVRLVRKP